jgi:hypoxanthine phosphoribosyltransferase
MAKIEISPAEAADVLANADRLHSKTEVEQALDEMAAEITEKMGDQNPIIMSVMNGGLIPSGQLLTRLGFPLRQDYLHASRYRGSTTGADLKWLSHPQESLKGEVVLVVDDILDEGYTLAAIVDACQKEGAKAVYSAVLVEKMHSRSNGFKADFVGIQVEDRYLFGYGMDYKGFLRNAAGIYAVKGL